MTGEAGVYGDLNVELSRSEPAPMTLSETVASRPSETTLPRIGS